MAKKHLTNEEKWRIDQLIMNWWDAETFSEKKRLEKDCLKLFNLCDCKEEFISYLKDNDTDKLADKMESDWHSQASEKEARRKAA